MIFLAWGSLLKTLVFVSCWYLDAFFTAAPCQLGDTQDSAGEDEQNCFRFIWHVETCLSLLFLPCYYWYSRITSKKSKDSLTDCEGWKTTGWVWASCLLDSQSSTLVCLWLPGAAGFCQEYMCLCSAVISGKLQFSAMRFYGVDAGCHLQRNASSFLKRPFPCN